MLHGRRNSSWSGGFAVTDAALRPRPRHGNICCDIALGAAVRRGRPNPEAIALRKVADYSPAASAERSAARLAHQSGGLGVASSNLAAPTNKIRHLCNRLLSRKRPWRAHGERSPTIGPGSAFHCDGGSRSPARIQRTSGLRWIKIRYACDDVSAIRRGAAIGPSMGYPTRRTATAGRRERWHNPK